MIDQRVEPVFIAPEQPGLVVAGLAAVMKLENIAAGTEPFLARTVDDNGPDAVVSLPGFQRLDHCQAHAMGQRVERLGPVQRDAAHLAGLAGKNFRFVGHVRTALINRTTQERRRFGSVPRYPSLSP